MNLPFYFAIALFALLTATVAVGGVLMWRNRKRLPTMMTADGRRVWAFAAVCGSCIVFTIFAAIGVWLLSKHALYTLILALAAHLQILIGMSAMGFLLGRRVEVEGTRHGVKLRDHDALDPVVAAQAATNAAQGVTDALKGDQK